MSCCPEEGRSVPAQLYALLCAFPSDAFALFHIFHYIVFRESFVLPLSSLRRVEEMYSTVALVAGLALLLSSLTFLALNKSHRDVVLGRLSLHKRRATGSFTPPRSLSPEKQGLPSNRPPSAPEYGRVFPPSRRHALAQVKLHGPGESGKELSERPQEFSKRVPHTEVANTDALADYATPTGFTVEEIKRLGDFPDYATLSGVPLPRPYEGFDIAKAVPRPYRPLRWAYHQTMCTWRFFPSTAAF